VDLMFALPQLANSKTESEGSRLLGHGSHLRHRVGAPSLNSPAARLGSAPDTREERHEDVSVGGTGHYGHGGAMLGSMGERQWRVPELGLGLWGED